MNNNVKDYGWTSNDHPTSCGYILPVILKILANYKGVSHICDIGSGNGALAAELFQNKYSVAGVEYDDKGIAVSRANYPSIAFYQLGVQDDPALLVSEQGHFDAVISTEVIEHLYSPHLLPQFAASILKENGLLIISTPYHGYLKNLALAILGMWDRHLTVLWHGGHIKFFSRRTLTMLLENNGFRVVAFHGSGRLLFLWKSMIIVAERCES